MFIVKIECLKKIKEQKKKYLKYFFLQKTGTKVEWQNYKFNI